MARHVVDVAATLPVLQGRDGSDPVTATYPGDPPADYVERFDADCLRGRRVGIYRLLRVDYESDRVVAAAERVLQRLGATTVDVDLPLQEEIGNNNFPALIAEFRRDLDKYLAQRDTGPNTLAELIAFNSADPVELSRFGQELLLDALAAPATDDAEYLHQRRAAITLARHSIDDIMLGHRLDAIMAPTNSPAWKIDYRRGDRFVLTTATAPAVAGYANVTVPAGFAGPLPVGVSFFAGPWTDAHVLSIAYAFERAGAARRPPRYLPVVRRSWFGRGGTPYYAARRTLDTLTGRGG
jgi:amidase